MELDLRLRASACGTAFDTTLAGSDRWVEKVIPGHVHLRRDRVAHYRNRKCPKLTAAKVISRGAPPKSRFCGGTHFLVDGCHALGLTHGWIQMPLEADYGEKLSLGVVDPMLARAGKLLAPAVEAITTAIRKGRELTRIARHRFLVERFHEEAKMEPRMDHFEGRRWRGPNHHLTRVLITPTCLTFEHWRVQEATPEEPLPPLAGMRREVGIEMVRALISRVALDRTKKERLARADVVAHYWVGAGPQRPGREGGPGFAAGERILSHSVNPDGGTRSFRNRREARTEALEGGRTVHGRTVSWIPPTW